jgi:carboxypeptidase C (cathepsin A)
MKVAILLVLVLLGVANSQTPADYLITGLPGFSGNIPFKQYSGFMESTQGNYIFFWFVESYNDPANDPVAYWTNGGPGASGLEYGFFTEHGPFRVAPDG